MHLARSIACNQLDIAEMKSVEQAIELSLTRGTPVRHSAPQVATLVLMLGC
jgi:hypothetical protein